MKHPPERDWMIVAPWWQWADPASLPAGQPVEPDPAQGRLSRPVFQKYDSPNLVNDFLKDPQRCLKYVEADLVHALQNSPEPLLSKASKLFRIGARKAKDKDGKAIVIDQRYVPDGTDTRKIFLNTHKRFYLVVCSIHCDSPGLPKAARNKICEAGFVVRRRTVTPPSIGADEVKPILKALAAGRARLARVNQLTEIENLALASASGQDSPPKSAKLESLLKTRASLQNLVAAEKARFNEWVERFGVVPQLQAWFKSPQGLDQIGYWAAVEETPDELGLESSFPLYPLIPDKNDPKHAGHFGTIYFGILPTSSRDTDATGRARFDDQEFYEVRCWVRRHKEPHDGDRPCPCPDPLFWSLPTDPFKLASHFDLDGTSNQPVTVQLPDLNVLAAQAKPSLGVGFAKPPGSLMVSADKDGNPIAEGRSSLPEICFFPIPLITIVATFVFQLFLPIITFLFGLWWMLALRFCIPPEIKLAGGIMAELGIDGKFGIDVDLDVSAELELKLDAGLNAADPDQPGQTQLQAQFGVDAADALSKTYSSIALAKLELDISRASEQSREDAPSVTAGLEFEAGVEHI